MAKNTRQNDEQITDADTFNILYFAVASWAMAFLPFLRSRQGVRAHGKCVLVALLIIAFYGGRTRSSEMQTYLKAWMGALVVRRLTADRSQHTQYLGWPQVTGLVISDEMTARLAEPMLLFVVGAAVARHHPALGHFLQWGGVPLVIMWLIDRTYAARQDEAINDAMVEMEYRTRRMNRPR